LVGSRLNGVKVFTDDADLWKSVESEEHPHDDG
jgi:hypothetical protein